MSLGIGAWDSKLRFQILVISLYFDTMSGSQVIHAALGSASMTCISEASVIQEIVLLMIYTCYGK